MSAAEEALALAESGNHVAWFVSGGYAEDILNLPVPATARVIRTNGKQRIEFASGGRIIILCVGNHAQSVRGRAIDYAWLPAWHHLRDDALLDNLLPAFGNEHPRIGVYI